MTLQKEVISNQKQPSCKKRVQPPKQPGVKSKVVAKKWLWWQVNGKTFNNDNSGEFGAES